MMVHLTGLLLKLGWMLYYKHSKLEVTQKDYQLIFFLILFYISLKRKEELYNSTKLKK